MKHIVTPEQVRRTAKLAKLCLNEQEVQLMCRDLAGLLEIADELERVDETGAESGARSFMLLREDVPQPCMLREDLLRNAPTYADGMLAVPGAIREEA